MDSNDIFYNYYKQQALRGYGIENTFRRSPIFQRGSGLSGSGIFSSILKSVVNTSKPLLKKAGKYVIKKGVKTASNITNDLLSGMSLKESASKNARKTLEKTKDDVAHMIRKKLHYSNGKPKRHIKRITRKKISNKTRFL